MRKMRKMRNWAQLIFVARKMRKFVPTRKPVALETLPETLVCYIVVRISVLQNVFKAKIFQIFQEWRAVQLCTPPVHWVCPRLHYINPGKRTTM